MLGTRIYNTSILRTDVKGGGVYSTAVIMSISTDRENLIYSSEADKQEWTSKIHKVREKAEGL